MAIKTTDFTHSRIFVFQHRSKLINEVVDHKMANDRKSFFNR